MLMIIKKLDLIFTLLMNKYNKQMLIYFTKLCNVAFHIILVKHGLNFDPYSFNTLI